MKFATSRFLCTLVGLAAVLGPQPTFADDSEVFTSSSFTSGAGVQANVLFIIDTSGSMDSEVRLYDSTKTYTGKCDPADIYWSTSSTYKAPTCEGNTHRIDSLANRCRAAYVGMQDDGWWNGRVFQLNATATTWVDLVDNTPDRKVECESDNRVHGDLDPSLTDSGTLKRARNGDGTARWGDKSSNGRDQTNRAHPDKSEGRTAPNGRRRNRGG